MIRLLEWELEASVRVGTYYLQHGLSVDGTRTILARYGIHDHNRFRKNKFRTIQNWQRLSQAFIYSLRATAEALPIVAARMEEGLPRITLGIRKGFTLDRLRF